MLVRSTNIIERRMFQTV